MTAPASAAAGARFGATSVGWRTGPSGCPVRWISYAQLPRRHPNRATDGGALVGRVVRSRAGRAGFFAGYAVFAGLVVVGSAALGYPWYTISVLTVGGLHLFYDGLIWKLRRIDVARGFGI